MNTLKNDFLAGIFDDINPPCLSLYQTTHRHHPDNRQDPIRFDNLIRELEESLERKFPKREFQHLLEPFRALADDNDFWNHSHSGLAVLGSESTFRVYKLQRPVADLAVVADSFHTKPLLRILQSADRYHVLKVSRQEISLFEGNRDEMGEIQLHGDVPRTLTEALGQELTEPHRTVASYGGAAGNQAPMQHGHGGKSAEVDIDAERFFRVVDKGILEHHSQPSGLPLVLVTLPEHQHVFRKVSDNPHLLDEGVNIHPDSISSLENLRERVWQLMEPRYLSRLDAIAEEFGNARPRGLGDDDIAQVAREVVAGRVATLMIEASREIPGRIDAVTGETEFDELGHPEVDDVLDDLGTLTLRMGGQVIVVPSERMPTKSGAAAIYRY